MKKVYYFIFGEIIAPLAILTAITAPFTGAMVYLLFK